MFFFKKKPKITELTVQKLLEQLETSYTEKDIDKITNMFHPEHRDISFLNHFVLMMNFQIYDIQSEILKTEIIHLTEYEATFTYTRKHIYTCRNKNDENGENPNNITSYHVQIQVENKKIWIMKFAKYSELFLDINGELLQHERAVVPSNAQFFENMRPYIESFQLDQFKPGTYYLYSDSEFIGYYPAKELFSYETTEKFTVDYFEEMNAATIAEHTETYLNENTLNYSDIIEVTESYSIIETKFMKHSHLQHELVMSILGPDGFYMIRYLKSNNTPIEREARENWIQQMKVAAKLTVH